MTAAIFGLIGVIVGGLLNVGVTYLFERQRGKSAAQTASRLVYQELMVNGAAVEVAAVHKDWKPLKENLVTIDWEANRVVFAGALPDDEWSPLVRAYYWIGSLIQQGEGKGLNDPLDISDTAFQQARIELHVAGRLMRPRAGVTDPFLGCSPSAGATRWAARAASSGLLSHAQPGYRGTPPHDLHVSCDIAYSRSPAAARASGVGYPTIESTIPSRIVKTLPLRYPNSPLVPPFGRSRLLTMATT